MAASQEIINWLHRRTQRPASVVQNIDHAQHFAFGSMRIDCMSYAVVCIAGEDWLAQDLDPNWFLHEILGQEL